MLLPAMWFQFWAKANHKLVGFFLDLWDTYFALSSCTTVHSYCHAVYTCTAFVTRRQKASIPIPFRLVGLLG